MIPTLVLWASVAWAGGDEIAIHPTNGAAITVGTDETRATVSFLHLAKSGARLHVEGSSPISEGFAPLFSDGALSSGTRLKFGIGFDSTERAMEVELQSRVDEAMVALTNTGSGAYIQEFLVVAGTTDPNALLEGWAARKDVAALSLPVGLQAFCALEPYQRLSDLALKPDALDHAASITSLRQDVVAAQESVGSTRSALEQARALPTGRLIGSSDGETRRLVDALVKAEPGGVVAPELQAYQSAVHHQNEVACRLAATDLAGAEREAERQASMAHSLVATGARSKELQGLIGNSPQAADILQGKPRFYIGFEAAADYEVHKVLPVGEPLGTETVNRSAYDLEFGGRLEADFGQWHSLRAYARVALGRSVSSTELERCTVAATEGDTEARSCETVNVLDEEPSGKPEASGTMGLAGVIVFKRFVQEEEEDAKVAPGIELRGDLTDISKDGAVLTVGARVFVAGLKKDEVAHVRGGIGFDLQTTFAEKAETVPSIYLLFGSVFQ